MAAFLLLWAAAAGQSGSSSASGSTVGSSHGSSAYQATAQDIALASSTLPPLPNNEQYYFPTQLLPASVRDCRYRDKDEVTRERNASSTDDWARRECHRICPQLPPPAQELECSDGGHHERVKADHRQSANFAIFFLAMCILVGALARRFLPKWIPYTVALLLIGMIMGGLSYAAEMRYDCPMNALHKYDRDHDEQVSRDEWREFTCDGCHHNSVCWPRSCSAASDGCWFSFDDLDTEFRLTPMVVSFVDKTAGDGLLSADEMWRSSCNLAADIIDVSNMDPHLLLLVFLPVLLFESAFAVDMGVLRKQFSQIWLMALAGVLIASLLTALLIMLLRPTWPFNVAWLIGTIMSATDPVAVVALLKDLGTDKAVGTLIEGESLLNDGSAVVLFSWIRNWIYHTNSDELPYDAQDNYPGTWVDLTRIVAQMLLFGILYGWVCGAALATILRRTYNDPIVEISLTIGGAYLVFWSAEMALASSAVIAVVIMGFYLNYHRALCISPEVVEVMHEFYEIVAWMLNTVIFFIAGYKLGSLFVFFGLLGDNSILGWFALYPGVLLTRGLTIMLLYPVLKLLGLGLDWKTAVVMWWGGLRGSVGLALALIIHHTEYSYKAWGGSREEDPDTHELLCRDIPRDTLFVNCIIVLLTVVVNGSTVGLLLKTLGMTTLPEDRKFMLNAAVKKLARETEHTLQSLRDQRDLPLVDWKRVEKNLVLMDDEEHIITHPLIAAWQEALNLERMSYAEQFHMGELGPAASERLEAILSATQAEVSAIARGAFNSATPTEEYQRATDKIIAEFKVPVFYERLRRVPLLRPYATRQIIEQLKVAYEMGGAFLRAHEHILHVAHERAASQAAGGGSSPQTVKAAAEEAARLSKAEKLQKAARRASLMSSGASLLTRAFSKKGVGHEEATASASLATTAAVAAEESADAATYAPKTLFTSLRRQRKKGEAEDEDSRRAEREQRAAILKSSEDPLMKVAHLSEKEVKAVTKAMDDMQNRSPLISRIVQNLHATNVALFRQRRSIEHMKENGEIMEVDAGELMAAVNVKLMALYRRPLVEWGLDGGQLDQMAERRNSTVIERTNELKHVFQRGAGGIAALLKAQQPEPEAGEETAPARLSRLTSAAHLDLGREIALASALPWGKTSASGSDSFKDPGNSRLFGTPTGSLSAPQDATELKAAASPPGMRATDEAPPAHRISFLSSAGAMLSPSASQMQAMHAKANSDRRIAAATDVPGRQSAPGSIGWAPSSPGGLEAMAEEGPVEGAPAANGSRLEA